MVLIRSPTEVFSFRNEGGENLGYRISSSYWSQRKGQ